MKKIFISFVALAAIAACSKTEVQYENSAEIGFAPVARNLTKAAMSGSLPETQTLGIWAYWNFKDGEQKEGYTEAYLIDAEFGNKTATIINESNESSTISDYWGGVGVSYPWPANGELIFAGYTKTVGLDVECNDYGQEIIFNNYTPANGFDLCWFCATAPCNHRNSGAAVIVPLSHALSWLTFNVTATGSAKDWVITDITLNGYASTGTGTCTNTASWVPDNYNGTLKLLENAEFELDETVQDIEGGAKNILVLPQRINPNNQTTGREHHTLSISYKFPVGETWKTDKKVVNLDLNTNPETSIDNEWKSGVRYIYTLTFKSNEILVSPSYGTWDEVRQGVTVE